MMKIKQLYIVALLLSQTIYGQDIYVKADYPKVVNAGETFSIFWTVNSGGGEFTGPSFDGFYKLTGPQMSYSSSTQIFNGKITQQTTNTYMYYFQAANPGKYVIAPAVFRYKNKEYKSDSLYIEVVGGQSGKQANPGKPDSKSG
jgi:hypothetical protein